MKHYTSPNILFEEFNASCVLQESGMISDVFGVQDNDGEIW